MSGGYLGIARARNFLRNTLLGRLPHMSLDGREPSADRLHVAVHLRLGDFVETATGPGPGVFDECLPVEWYQSTLEAVRDCFGDALHVDLMSDDPERAARLLPEWSGRGSAPRRTALADLSVMAAADLLICSISSFSMLAAFLSDAPYVWYHPHLSEQEGFLSIWGVDPAQRTDLTAANMRCERQDGVGLPARGVAMRVGDELPPWLAVHLRMRVALRRRSADLIHFGVVPDPDPQVRSRPVAGRST
jgi:hypothetical protein